MNIRKKGFPYPIGSKKKEKLMSVLASPETSLTLVKLSDSDSWFFRELEAQGVLLNREQLEAVRSIKGPNLIVAAAGSGKTRVLTSRTSYILTYDTDVLPSQVLLITFTKKAAKEMLERMKQMPHLKEDDVDSIVCGTFHSVFLRFLRKRGFRQKIIGSEDYREIIMKRILRELKLEEQYGADSPLSQIAFWKNHMFYPEDIEPNNRFESDMKKIYIKYEEWKYENNYLDFDDILLEFHGILKQDEEYRETLSNQFKYLLLDEFQDVNGLQNEIIMMLTHSNSNIFFVGDPRQLVYGFRSASFSHLLGLSERFPDITKKELITNYRSSTSIVGAANRVIAKSPILLGKETNATFTIDDNLWFCRPASSDEEARWITDHIVQEVRSEKKKLDEFAVLYRTHNNSRALVDELVYRHVPFVIYGNDKLFYEKRFVKPLISHLRLVIHEDDIDAIADIAPTCYISRETAYNQALNFTVTDPDKSLIHSLLRINCSSFQKTQVVTRLAIIKKLKGLRPQEAIKYLRKSFYDKYVEANDNGIISMQKDFIQDALDELEDAAKRFERIDTFIRFINDITTIYAEMEELRKEPNPNAVKLMTIHQSKGLEFPTIMLIGASDHILPHASALNADKYPNNPSALTSEEALEEERRLLYVAMTRAEKELFISSPKTLHEKSLDTSRFLIEAYS